LDCNGVFDEVNSIILCPAQILLKEKKAFVVPQLPLVCSFQPNLKLISLGCKIESSKINYFLFVWQAEFQMVIRSTLDLPRLAEAELEMLSLFKGGVLPQCFNSLQPLDNGSKLPSQN
jgi:hypothetical protein